MQLLDGKVALVTGAATGIGEAVARRFAAEGATLALNDIDEVGLSALVEDLRAAGTPVSSTPGDASDPAVIGSWVDQAAAAHGSVDVLYANVGVSRPGKVGDITDESWRLQQRLTLDTTFYAIRAVLPHMQTAGGGSIIAMSSGAGIGGRAGLGAYATAKAGVIALVQTVAAEYGPEGIRANAVTPGPTATAPLLAYVESRPGGVEGHVADLNLQRLTLPEEVAATVTWLASDQASGVTGICVQCNTRAAGHRTTT